VDNREMWLSTEKMVREALVNGGLPFKEIPNESAFYGPKIDVQIWSVIGKEFSLATNQVDFAVPGRFGLVYKDSDGSEKTPLCIHRAPLGTHERFIGFLIEHFAGNFPLWLAPVQVKVLNITSLEEGYASGIAAKLKAAGLRAALDLRSDTISSKVRDAAGEKVPYALIVGKNEQAEGKVSLRLRGNKNIYGLDLNEVIANLVKEAGERRLTGSY